MGSCESPLAYTMKSKKVLYAKVVAVRGQRTPNGYEAIWQLRAGKTGKGKLLQSCRVIPNSAKSRGSAADHLFSAAEKQGYLIECGYPETKY